MSGSPSTINEFDSLPSDSPTTRPVAFVLPNPPRLRLIHVLLYITVGSFFLAFISLPHATERIEVVLPTPGYDARVRIDEVLTGLGQCAVLTIVLLLPLGWFRGLRVGNQPGHWMAIWSLWSLISTFCVVKLIDFAEWVARVKTPDDFIRVWPWAKDFHLLGDVPFAIPFLLFVFAWRGIANTLPWRLYFGCCAW
jgi:hypothetical protein